MTEEKTIAIGQILRPQELDKARNIFYSDYPNFHQRCTEELILPNLTRINSSTGQQNDPRYLSYVVEAAFLRWGDKKPTTRRRKNNDR